MAIDGLVSGLNTTEIIANLMAIEKLPQDAMVARQETAKNQLSSYASVRAKLTALGTAANALASAAKWNQRTASSTSSSTASVSATSTASVGSLTFSVDRVATSHGLSSATTIASTSTVVASGGTLSIDLGDGAGPQSIDVGGGTLQEVAAAINGAGLGIRATTVNTGAGFRLQMSSTSTGADSAFTVDGLDPSVGGTVVTTEGVDAQLTIGTGPGAYSVTSSSNTFSDLMPGVSVTAVTVSATPVTVNVAEDVTALSNAVKALVEAANAALSEISLRTAFNAETKSGASLNGDATMRRAAQEITRSVALAVGASSLGSVGAAGVSLDRTGRLTFDADKFTKAYAADPSAVRNLFAQQSATTGDVSFVSAGGRARTGSFDVEITTAAQRASTTGLAGGWPLGSATTVSLRVGSVLVEHEIGAGESAADAAAGLQLALDGAGLQLDVVENGGGLSIATRGYGSAQRFEVAWDGVDFSSHEGVDVAGTIGGVAAVGTGQQLQVPFIHGSLGGITVNVTGSATGSVGTVDYSAGVAQRLATMVTSANDLVDGYLTAAETGRKNRIDTLSRSIADFDNRLAAREARLRSYWTTLEVSLGKLKDQSSWLAGQLGSLTANSGSS
ncbi:MAG: flagellar filament capping protein FliD [Actinomycetota bacterium]|nr:flagellar filament capping protein FliD [Actinomycetota bacterium]